MLQLSFITPIDKADSLPWLNRVQISVKILFVINDYCGVILCSDATSSFRKLDHKSDHRE